MNDHPEPVWPSSTSPDPLPVAQETPEPQPRRKGWTVLSWLVIAALVTIMVAVRAESRQGDEGASANSIQFVVLEKQAQYLVGAAKFLPPISKDLWDQAKILKGTTLAHRLRFAILAGEFAGPKEALVEFGALDQGLAERVVEEGFRIERLLGDILGRLYADYAAGRYDTPSVTDADKALLREHLGWFGRLALNPPPPAAPPQALAAPAGAAALVALENFQPEPNDRAHVLSEAFTTFAIIFSVFGSVLFVAFGGFIGLIVFIILLKYRKLQGGVTVGSGHGGVYAEAFALWLAAFLGLGLFVAAVELRVPPLVQTGIPILTATFLGLLWPVLRGVPLAQMRRELGLTLGRNPAVEPLAGLACYIISLPIIGVGVLLTYFLFTHRQDLGIGTLAANGDIPVHPIVEDLVFGDTWQRVLVFVLACVLAPLVEEIMFRGILYQHLRELTGRWRWFASFVCSGTIVSFVFAVIHPPGMVAVPALMAIAFALTIAREWRGSLIAPMVAHGFHNGLLLLVVVLLMG